MVAVEGVNGQIYMYGILSIKVASPAKRMMLSDLLNKSLNVSWKLGELLSFQIICEILFAVVYDVEVNCIAGFVIRIVNRFNDIARSFWVYISEPLIDNKCQIIISGILIQGVHFVNKILIYQYLPPSEPPNITSFILGQRVALIRFNMGPELIIMITIQ